MTKEFIDFVKKHLHDDTSRLLLSAARYPSIDMPAAVRKIEGIRTAQDKWPSLLDYDDFIFPPRLNREQSSSETAAEYKASLIAPLCNGKEHVSIADLTGGMGIDSLKFAHPLEPNGVTTHVDYVDRDPELCHLMEHNRNTMGLKNVAVHCGDSMKWVAACASQFDLLYIDPARRSQTGRKVAAFEECEPNILHHLPLLLSRCRWLLVKASPMIDLDRAISQLGSVAEVHIVAVKGECKEVLFLCGRHDGEPLLHCVNIAAGKTDHYAFSRSDEQAAEPQYCSAAKSYIYEPDASLMKGGPFNLLCQWLDIEKLSRNTHLYTADTLIEAFPGRTFRVLAEVHLNRKEISRAIPDGKAHVVTRNYPVEADALQRQLGLKEGGRLFILATTVGSRKTGYLCCRPGEESDFLKAK